MIKKFLSKWSIAFRIIPILLIISLSKYFVHIYWYEIISFNALFSSLIAGTIFLLWFLISWVMSDYKESEKIPSELSASLESLFDISYCINSVKNSSTSKEFIIFQKKFINDIEDWFYKKIKTHVLIDSLGNVNNFFVQFEKEWIQPNVIIKMQNEQWIIRRIILRIHTIRDTNFIDSAYAIVEALWFFIAIWMILMKIEPFYEWILFSIIVVFLISYMFFLISDLDNPFDYVSHWEVWTEVPLKPFNDFRKRLNDFVV